MRRTVFIRLMSLLQRTVRVVALALGGGLLGALLWGFAAGPAAPAFADDNPYVDVRLTRISLIEGELLFQRGDDDEWTAASVNMPLRPHDRLWTTDGARSEVQLDDGTAVRIAENTNLDLLDLELGMTQMQLTLGVVSITTPPSRRATTVELDTPQASLQLSPASTVRVDVAEDGSTVITVWDGEATINRNEGPLTVAVHQRVAIESGDTPRYELEPASAGDEWDQWVDERAGQLAKAKSLEHLGPDMAATGDMGATELDTYGNWDQVPSYGWVWVPHVAPNWVPYQSGRWIWREPWGWTWVSYEPWGWLPYHYGRWIVVSAGWVWVPGPSLGFWTPGCVRFIYGPDWVAWVPLGPGEIYYYYPPMGAVNATLINYHTHGAVIVRSRREFVGGRDRTQFMPPRDPMHTGRVAFGPPPIVPTRYSLRPFPRLAVLPHQLPPRVTARPVVYRHEPAPMPAPFDERLKNIHGTITKGHPPIGIETAPVKRGQPQPEERHGPTGETVYRGMTTHKTLPAAPPSSEGGRIEGTPKGEASKSGHTHKSGQPSAPKVVEFGRRAEPPAAEGARQLKPLPKLLYKRPPQTVTPGDAGSKKPSRADSNHSGSPDGNRGGGPGLGDQRLR
jgi:hypothetical protein